MKCINFVSRIKLSRYAGTSNVRACSGLSYPHLYIYSIYAPEIGILLLKYDDADSALTI
jgi:hypothetical protein